MTYWHCYNTLRRSESEEIYMGIDEKVSLYLSMSNQRNNNTPSLWQIDIVSRRPGVEFRRRFLGGVRYNALNPWCIWRAQIGWHGEWSSSGGNCLRYAFFIISRVEQSLLDSYSCQSPYISNAVTWYLPDLRVFGFITTSIALPHYDILKKDMITKILLNTFIELKKLTPLTFAWGDSTTILNKK